MIESDKSHFQEINLLKDNILEIKKSLKDVVEKLGMLSDEVNNFAKRTELITLQKYIDFWQPVDFVTRKEANAFLKRKFKSLNIPISNNQSKEDKKEVKKEKVSIEDAYPDNV